MKQVKILRRQKRPCVRTRNILNPHIITCWKLRKRRRKKNEAQTAKQSQELEKSILNDKNLLGGVSMDVNIRKKVVENIMNPAYKDESTNTYYTAIQKYQKEHPMEFIKNLGILYTLTDGFKSIDGIVMGKVKKEVKKPP